MREKVLKMLRTAGRLLHDMLLMTLGVVSFIWIALQYVCCSFATNGNWYGVGTL